MLTFFSFVGRMAKGKAVKKQPDTWETVCQATNTVLEVAKVRIVRTLLQKIVCLASFHHINRAIAPLW